uniref:Uncharacterized protein n=1 Tax=Prasinoderma coloniale TaxID=156133 RepID=A0A6U0N650_9VIRI|mmetsp:Transcript_1892/g.7594  ORF Transcript_1892/g.7594 Transcript_1892/m.7594 type:complete len:247 (+) Transcript_1892:145-885(+)
MSGGSAGFGSGGGAGGGSGATKAIAEEGKHHVAAALLRQNRAAAAEERDRKALLLATRTLGVTSAEVRSARDQRTKLEVCCDWFRLLLRYLDSFRTLPSVWGRRLDAEIACRGTGGVGNAGAGSPGDASATNARHALLLARRALSTNAEALTLAHAERDALQKELDAAINSLIVGSKWNLDRAVLCACQQGRADCLYLLLEAGADPSARDGIGRTALELAEARWRHGGREETAALLRQWGAAGPGS